MPIDKIKTTDFAAAARRHAEESVKTADRNGNGLLSALEAASTLPEDLRDNFENFDDRTSGNVTTRRFNASFAGYSAASANRADADRDGFLTAEEGAKLPLDLQDNFATLFGEIGGVGGRMTDAQLQTHFASAIDVQQGPRAGVTQPIAVTDVPPEARPAIEEALASLIADGDELTEENFLKNDVHVVFASETDRTVVGFAVNREAFNADAGIGAKQVLGFNLQGNKVYSDWESI